MTILEFMKFSNEDGFDIADEIFDWCDYFAINTITTEKDSYDVVMMYFANNIEMVNYRKGWYSSCKISEFIQKHRKAFDEFMRTTNNEHYQPSDEVSIDDEEFYDLYLMTFQNLIDGNYSDSDYERLYDLLLKYFIDEAML